YSRARPSPSNTAPPPSASSPSSSTAAVLLNQLNIPSQFREGLRVTDARTMEVSIVLVCKVNKDLVSRINFAGATAVGLPPKRRPVRICRRSCQSPPNSPATAWGHRTHPGDCFSGAFQHCRHGSWRRGAALGEEKLILLTDVAGILRDREDPGSLGVKKMTEERKVGGGMIPKVNCCIRSLAQEVTTASIVDGRVEHSLLHEVYDR
ncbi:hypothetical protein QQP08_011190, partial [Theobroma cacao]